MLIPERHRSTQWGATLLEILISILIFSIGLLGLASMQITSKRANYEALQRSTAAVLAHGMLERMRVNQTALDSYVAAGNLGGGSLGSAPATDCAAANCLPTELSAYHLWSFEQELDGQDEQRGGVATGGLASATACISGPPGGSGTYSIVIAWRGSAELESPADSACGLGLGLYGDGDSLRRVLTITTFIGAI